jgi:stress response protein YsnF
MEEVVVIERRLILKEEVRVTRVRSTEHHRERVVLRKQDAVITRTEAGAETGGDNPLSLGTSTSTPTREQQE